MDMSDAYYSGTLWTTYNNNQFMFIARGLCKTCTWQNDEQQEIITSSVDGGEGGVGGNASDSLLGKRRMSDTTSKNRVCLDYNPSFLHSL
jgi:hypothetical protein